MRRWEKYALNEIALIVGCFKEWDNAYLVKSCNFRPRELVEMIRDDTPILCSLVADPAAPEDVQWRACGRLLRQLENIPFGGGPFFFPGETFRLRDGTYKDWAIFREGVALRSPKEFDYKVPEGWEEGFVSTLARSAQVLFGRRTFSCQDFAQSLEDGEAKQVFSNFSPKWSGTLTSALVGRVLRRYEGWVEGGLFFHRHGREWRAVPVRDDILPPVVVGPVLEYKSDRQIEGEAIIQGVRWLSLDCREGSGGSAGVRCATVVHRLYGGGFLPEECVGLKDVIDGFTPGRSQEPYAGSIGRLFRKYNGVFFETGILRASGRARGSWWVEEVA